MRGSSSCVKEAVHGKRGLLDRCVLMPFLQRSPCLVETVLGSDAGDPACLLLAASWTHIHRDLREIPLPSAQSLELPLPPKTCGYVIGTVGKELEGKHRHVPMCLNIWTFIYLKEATKSAHLMHSTCILWSSLQCSPIATGKKSNRLKIAYPTELQSSRDGHYSHGNPNSMELIINRIKMN